MATSANKLIKDWKSILIDTSIICSLFNSENPETKDKTILFIRKLIDYLCENPLEKKERIFYISTITISELLTKEHNTDKIKRILRVLNSNNVEFIDFDLETSLSFNRQLYPYLSKDILHEKARQFGFKSNDFMMARQWISKDLMILCSGNQRGIDVVITVDKKTMFPLANELGLFCVLAYPELFEVFKSAILKYKWEEVDDFLKK